jgi:chromosomal replication initiator protein
MTNEELWRSTLGELELLISKANFTTWFKSTSIVSVNEGQVVVAVPNAFTKAWLEKKYHGFITKALQNIAGDTVKRVDYRVELTPNVGPRIEAAAPVPTPAVQREVSNNFGLNPRYTFETFIVGKNNELARAAALAVAQNPGVTYNPLFLYGGVGLGKTHLMQAIGHEILKQNPDKHVLYVPCEKFTTEFIQAIGSGKIERFKSTYRSVDVLLVDDIQFLAGKEGTQEEFFHTFNTLHQANKQIVLSSDRPPKAIQTLENRLVSRFEWGMIADIASPDLETRTAILETKCRERNYHLEPDIISYLAANIQHNIRELEGALNRLIAYHQLNNRAPSLESVKELLHGLQVGGGHNKSLTGKKIVTLVAQYYDVSTDDLLGTSRKKHLVEPRQVAMYLMREELKASFPTIGQEMGGRDHTTAMHSCLKVAKEVEVNEKTRQDIHNLKQQLGVV